MFTRVLKLKLAAMMLAWLAALFVVAWLVFAGRQAALERGEDATVAFAAVVEQQVARTFQAANLTVGAIGDAHRLTPRPGKHDREFQEMMSRRLKDVPFIRAVFIIGPDGRIIHDTDHPATPAVSLADRVYFRAYQADPARGPSVWPPLRSRSGMGQFLPVTHPLGLDGGFEGVVVAALQAAQFEDQFREARLPAGYLVTLFHSDGTLVASHPSLGNRSGENFKERLPELASMEEERAGSAWSDTGLLPGRRMVGYRAVERAPFVVRVSRARNDMLSEWRRTATAAALAMSALTILLAWFMTRLARESERQVRERERRLQMEKLEALGQLSGGMAHDFANVLHVVAMNAGLLRAKPGDRQVAEHALAAVERALASGRQVAERLLAFARRKPLARARIRLDAFLEQARPLLEQAAGHRVTLDVQTRPPLPEIVCDSGELDVALLNLVVNARDAMGGSGRVSVRAYPCDHESGAPERFVASPPRHVCVTVQDTGPGMTEEIRRRALEPFFTTKGESGTGLGLSQAYGFMQQLGGQLVLESAPGRGTAVHLYFPVAPAVGGD